MSETDRGPAEPAGSDASKRPEESSGTAESGSRGTVESNGTAESGSSDTVESNGQGEWFEGRWLAPDGGVHVIARRGDGLKLDSVVENTAAMHGRGTVIDGVAVIDVVDACGNAGRFEMTLAADGGSLTGWYSGPMGQTAIRLSRRT